MRPLPKLPTSSAPLSLPVVRGQGEPPGRVQRAPGDQPADQRAVAGEDVHESVARPGHVIFAACVLLGIGHVELAREFRDVEWRVTGRKPAVREPAAGQSAGLKSLL